MDTHIYSENPQTHTDMKHSECTDHPAVCHKLQANFKIFFIILKCGRLILHFLPQAPPAFQPLKKAILPPLHLLQSP